MKFQSRTLDGRQWVCHGLLTFFLTLALCPMASAQTQTVPPVSAQVSHTGDTSHLEIQGRDSWDYSLHRETRGNKTVVVMQVPKLDAKSILDLKTWSSPLIASVLVSDRAPEGQTVLTFVLKDADVQSFDYETDQPSRLIVDFFRQLDGNKAKVAPKPRKKTVAGLSEKIRVERNGDWTPERAPASSELLHVKTPAELVETGNLNEQRGIFDGGDPNYSRFKVKDYEINENAIIASQQNIYLRFPALQLEEKHFKALLNNPPVYEIKPEDSRENQEARLLLTFFQENHYGEFFKTYKDFVRKYPDSKYSEIIRYMNADLFYNRWKESGSGADFDKAMAIYRGLIDKYPNSPLSERTKLVVAYSYLKRQDFISALRFFQDFVHDNAKSTELDYAKIGMAESLLGLKHYDEAKQTLVDLQTHALQPRHAVEATFRLGDIAFDKQDYAGAVDAYRSAIKAHPDDAQRFPNAYFNIAESLFWLGQYHESLDAYREYLERFPANAHGGYAMTRIGELMEILGVDQKRAMGAFLECYFRYNSTPGAKVARIRLLSQRMKNMKPKELQNAIAEADEIAKESDLPEMPEFETIMISDGLYKRGEYADAIKTLVQFYQHNPSSKGLAVIQKRIVRDITQKLKAEIDSGDFMAGLKTYGQYSESWLHNSPRIDIKFYLGKAYEQAGVFSEADRLYRDAINRIYSLKGTKEAKERNVIESLPSTDTLNLRLASVNLQQGNFSKALNHLKDIQSPQTLSDREKVERVEIEANIAEKTDHSKDALTYLNELISSWKGEPQLVASPLLKVAQITAKMNQYDKAQTALEKIVDLQKDTNLVPADTLAAALELNGDINLKQGRLDKAIQAYSTLLDKFEKVRPLSSVRYRMGEIEYKRGNIKQARDIWQPLADGPGKIWYQLAQEQLSNDQFQDTYKKYFNRLPASTNQEGDVHAKP